MNAPTLNCDLGEGESTSHTIALMRCIDAANIACGGHAGDESTMMFCIEQAMLHQVKIGAHPGVPSQGGRGLCSIDGPTLRELLNTQVLPFCQRVIAAGATLHHIKLHGALYHATDRNADLAQTYLDWCREHVPDAIIVARSHATTARLALEQNLACWQEGFLDRSYESDGSLRDRSHADAVFHDLRDLENRLDLWATEGVLQARGGEKLALPCDTFCLHSDTPQSLVFASAVRHRWGPRAVSNPTLASHSPLR